MIELINAASVCGLLFIPCLMFSNINRKITAPKQTQQQKLCSTFKVKPDWCISKIEPHYPTIKRDTTQ
jgi:hypothetical protein